VADASPGRPGVLARLSASVRVRATAGAVVVVGVVLTVAAVSLVLAQRESLRDGAEAAAEARATQVAEQVAASGPPEALLADADDAEEDDGDTDAEPEDVVLEIRDDDRVVVASQPEVPLPDEDDGVVTLPGGDHDYVLADAESEWAGREYTVVVAVSLEDADESTSALVPLLIVGTPLVLLLVGAITWLVIGRALAPVERMRREVASITDDRLDRRVDVPPSGDEVHRLGGTMNAMLARLQAARDRQRRFVSDASHELRSPIATLRQSGEVAQRHPDAFERGELADTVVAESLRLQRLVDQLLVLTRVDEGRTVGDAREVDLDDLVLAEAARTRRERTGLEVDTSRVGPARVLGDPLALAQIVRNLVDNAARHAHSTVGMGLVEEAGRVRLEVADDGAGIPPGDRDRVFERFVRLDEARARDGGGSGLGLAIVRELVAAHHGTVAVVDTPSGGALFVVGLPVAPATGPEPG
jgi:signal transduction histidine kinase